MCAAPLRREATRGMDNTHRHPSFTTLPTKKGPLGCDNVSENSIGHAKQSFADTQGTAGIDVSIELPNYVHSLISSHMMLWRRWRWRREMWTSLRFMIRFGHTQGISTSYWGIVTWNDKISIECITQVRLCEATFIAFIFFHSKLGWTHIFISYFYALIRFFLWHWHFLAISFVLFLLSVSLILMVSFHVLDKLSYFSRTLIFLVYGAGGVQMYSRKKSENASAYVDCW